MRKYQTPESVNSAILKVLENSTNNAAEQLLFDLYQEGQLYWGREFHEDLCLYSHPELSEASVIPADGVDFLSSVTDMFMGGKKCLSLNDSELSFSIRGFLCLIYQRLLNRPDLYAEDFANTVEALNDLRGQMLVSAAKKPDGSMLLIWASGVNPEKLPRKTTIKQCSLPQLFEFAAENKDAIVRIHTQDRHVETTVYGLLTAAHACKLVPDAASRSGIEQIGLMPVDTDFRYSDLMIERASELIASSEEEVRPVPNKGSGILALFRKKEKAEKPIPIEAYAQEENSDESKRSPKFKISGKAISISVFAILFSIVAVAIAWRILAPTPLETVKEDIQLGNYDTLPENYSNCVASNPDNKEVLISLMTEDLDNKVAGYAANTISTEEIAKVLVAYQKIPPMKDKANTAYHAASALEQSKIAYKKGLAATSIFTRLTYWRSVIKADTWSNAAMIDNLAVNAETYKAQAFAEIENQNDKTALSNLYLLQSFYVNDQEISARITELQNRAFSSTTNDPSSTVGIVGAANYTPRWAQAPIVISKFSIKQVGFEGWNTIYLDWGNRTEKEIASIVFELYPYDHAGNCLSTTVDTGDGLYSKYQAKFEGPFASGQMVQGYYFTNVWCNANIVSARVDAVIITYADGTIVTFFNSSDIAGLFATS